MEMVKENVMKELLNMELSSEELDVFKKKLEEKRLSLIEDNVKKNNSALIKLERKLEHLEQENNGLKDDIQSTKDKLSIVEDKTNIIEFDDPKQLSEIKKLSQCKIINLLGGDKSSAQYKLLFRPSLTNLYGKINFTYNNGNRLGKIKNDKELIIAIKQMIKMYTLDKKIINNKISQFQKEIDKGNATEQVKLNFEDMLEWCNEYLY